MSLWYCEEHKLTGPTACCPKASRAEVGTPSRAPAPDAARSLDDYRCRECNRPFAECDEPCAEEGLAHHFVPPNLCPDCERPTVLAEKDGVRRCPKCGYNECGDAPAPSPDAARAASPEEVRDV